MKLLIGILVLCLYAPVVFGQFWSHMFLQKEKQKVYLLEQIAALKVYGRYLSRGHTITRDGLNTISRLKDGELGLHEGYFTALKNINPAIAGAPQVKAIIQLQQHTEQAQRKTMTLVHRQTFLTSEEKQYVEEVYQRLADDCEQTIADLEIMVTSGQAEMKDDERLKRIDALYQQSLSQYQFAISFGADVMLLANARSREQKGVTDSKALFNPEK